MKLVRTSAAAPDAALLREVAAELARGGLALLPTETVYGVAARLDQPEAVRALVAAKGRPNGKPLQVLAAECDVRALAASWEEPAASLAERFWPGPLTLVVPARDGLPPAVMAADGTIGLRCPGHVALLALLRLTGPLAASSANRSGEQPALTCGDAVAALGPAVAVALDTGPADGGVPSSVVRVVRGSVQILRHGAVGAELIRAALPCCEVE